jgi:GH35 family endo-1,4-beta-xylanase
MLKFKITYLFLIFSIAVSAQTWKKAAQDSILKYRTTPLEILITDADGNPAEGVSVRVNMLRHDFKWGTVVSISEIQKIIGPGNRTIGDYGPYFSHFSLFNTVTPENAGKWKGWINQQERSVYLKTMDWLKSQGILNRGHACVWESERFDAIPDFLKNTTDTAWIRNAVKSQIQGQLDILKDYVYEIDVVNELIHEQHIVRDLLHISNPALEHSRWYKWAKQTAPNVDLIANEFDLFQSGNNFYQTFINYVRQMMADGAPIDGVGMQGHFFSAMPSFDELKKRINQVKVLGLPMSVTEFDMAGNSYTDMERVLYAVFSEPQIHNFTMWGAWDGNQWRKNGPLFYKNWDLKPSGKAWMDLVHGLWWTDSAIVTDASGNLALNAFKGEHTVELRLNDKVFIDTFYVGNQNVELQFKTNLINAVIPTASLSIHNELKEYNVYQPVDLVIDTDFADSILQVEFMEGMFLAHKDISPPFNFSMTSTSVVKREIYARVTSKKGFVFTTDTVSATFVNKNAFPVINNVYPFNNQFFGVAPEVDVTCDAIDYDGGIWKVELSGNFGDTIIVDSVAPFEFKLSGLAPGNYDITLKALDSLHAFDMKNVQFTVFDPKQQNHGFDLTPPGPPINLEISAQTGTSIAIEWEKPVDGAAIGYFIYVDSKKYLVNAIKPTKYKIENLPTDSPHQIHVTAINNLSIESGESNVVTTNVVSAGSIGARQNILSAHPNPFSKSITIENLDLSFPGTIEILDINGKIVQSFKINPEMERIQWDGKDYFGNEVPEGLYLVRYSGKSNVSVLKIVKL